MRHPWFQRAVMLMLVLLMQGPALLTQEIAWVRMLMSYTAERGLVQGVSDTFDGEHPCEMCHQAEQLRQAGSESRQPLQAPGESTLRWLLEWAKSLPPQRIDPCDLAGVEIEFSRCGPLAVGGGRGREAPLAPPPRRA